MSTSKKTIDDAYNEALTKYAYRESVSGIDIGYKHKNGEPTDILAIRLHVKEKISKSALETSELFPEEIEGFPVDVIQGNYTAAMQRVISAEATSRTTRLPCLRPGVSIAHKNVSAGTLGMFVLDKRSGKHAILSNWHVLAGEASATPGDPIVQPGPYDGGRDPRDRVANLERMILDKDGDAAIALLTNTRPLNPAILDLNITPDSVADPEIGEIVVKSGRTTQVTKGRVDGKGRYFIQYPVGRVGVDGFVITPLNEENPTDDEISMGGDSGAAWLKEGTSTAVGLHFAGETDPRPSEEHAIACYMTRVFKRLDVELLSADKSVKPSESNTAISLLCAQLGEAATTQVFETLDPREIRRWAAHLERSYPHLLDPERSLSELTNIDSAPEIGPFGAVAIGFAAGAAARIVGKNLESAESISSEAFPIVVSAFIAGAVTGARAVDGKL